MKKIFVINAMILIASIIVVLYISFIYQRNEVTNIIVFILYPLFCVQFVAMYYLYKEFNNYKKFQSNIVESLIHEMKMPVANITLAAEMINDLDLVENTENTSKNSIIIVKQTKRLLEIIEQIHANSTFKSSNINIIKEKADINSTIESTIESIKPTLDKQKAEIKTEFTTVDPLVFIDIFHFKNVLVNLLDNALKHTNNIPSIVIRTYNKGKYTIIEISDNGIGISKDKYNSIFERHFAINITKNNSFGVGLFYSKEVIRAHKGTIKVNSTPGKGSTFIISLKQFNYEKI